MASLAAKRYATVKLPSAGGISSRRPRGDTSLGSEELRRASYRRIKQPSKLTSLLSKYTIAI